MSCHRWLALAAAASIASACSTAVNPSLDGVDSGLRGGSSSGSSNGSSTGSSGGSGTGSSGSSSGFASSSGSGSGSGSGVGTVDGGSSRDATPTDGPGGADAPGAGEGGMVDGGSRATDGGDGGAVEGGGAGAPGVRIVGRTTAGTAGPRFEWSGVSIAARFTGTQVSIQLSDASNRDEFEVVVDGTTQPTLVTRPGATTYPLATGLANGTHDLLVWRRTEASYGSTEFLGLTAFGPGGSLLAPLPAPAHQIEIVGDSISCGYGIEGTSTCTNAQLESIENNYLAYGSVAGRGLGADVVTTAWSGIGVYRNYNQAGPSTDTMPQRYDYAIPTDKSAWDFSKYQPQAVVINLTSNDFSTMGDPGQPYVDAFVAFVQHIRSKYAGAYIFLVIEWRGNGSDSAPDVNAVVSKIQSTGDANIESFDIRPYANGNGCQGHPDVAGSQAMGNALAAEIKRVLKW